MTRYIEVFYSPELRKEGFQSSENFLPLLANKTIQGRKTMGCSGLGLTTGSILCSLSSWRSC